MRKFRIFFTIQTKEKDIHCKCLTLLKKNASHLTGQARWLNHGSLKKCFQIQKIHSGVGGLIPVCGETNPLAITRVWHEAASPRLRGVYMRKYSNVLFLYMDETEFCVFLFCTKKPPRREAYAYRFLSSLHRVSSDFIIHLHLMCSIISRKPALVPANRLDDIR